MSESVSVSSSDVRAATAPPSDIQSATASRERQRQVAEAGVGDEAAFSV
jgi:hypothetical protein